MPTYQYQCCQCHYYFEMKRMCYGSPVTKQCPQCQAIANKVISPVAFKIKGYSAKNDYSKAGITKEELDRHDGKEEKDE